MKPRISLSSLFLLVLLLLTACAPAQSATDASPQETPAVARTATQTPQPTPTTTPTPPEFDGERAYADVKHQVSLGPRLPESEAHAKAVSWIQENLAASGWEVELQETTMMDHPVRNIIARRGSGEPWIILGAHYDSRLEASEDPNTPQAPVPGANDGASGVGVLLELARVLPKDLDKQVWLVFFDAEDQGRLPGWDWILGSRAFVNTLQGTPNAVIIVDMIGDANLNLPREQNSNQELLDEVWEMAASRGHAAYFLPNPGYNILDDHTPFLEKGIRAIDIIDFDYPYWHTVEDTVDKVSPESLYIVGDTLLHWLME